VLPHPGVVRKETETGMFDILVNVRRTSLSCRNWSPNYSVLALPGATKSPPGLGIPILHYRVYLSDSFNFVNVNLSKNGICYKKITTLFDNFLTTFFLKLRNIFLQLFDNFLTT
jgi:hypothetical protein